jgi:cell division protein FtsB
MKPLIVLLLILLLVLQYKLWLSPGGFVETHHLKKQIEEQNAINAKLQEQNAILIADVKALKKDNNAIESTARKDLGMIKQGEVFYQVVK